MMNVFFRDTALGKVLRFLTRSKILRYPEEEDGFALLENYQELQATDGNKEITTESVRSSSKSLKSFPSSPRYLQAIDIQVDGTSHTSKSIDLENDTVMGVLKPTRTLDGTILVDWYNSGKLVRVFILYLTY
jgi:hypothetical protein